MFLIDAHQDLAWNILTFGRDYTRSAAEIRQREIGSPAPALNGDTLLGYPEYQKGRVVVIFASLFAAPLRRKQGDWDKLCYDNHTQANTLYSQQLEVYHRLTEEHPDKFRLVQQQADLKLVLDHWEMDGDQNHPVGLVILMEGAEAIHHASDLEEWWQRGVRIIGPAWTGNRFCGGTREPGPLTKEGYTLLEGMSSRGYILDLSHMDERAAIQALDMYPNRIVVTHANPAALLPGVDSNRFLSDRLIQGMFDRDGIIGIIPYNRFLKWGWTPSDGREAVKLDQVVTHIDYICQITGDAYHVGIGSDFDGGFGLQATPAELETVADLHKIIPLLEDRGYTEDNIAAIMGENWLSLLRQALPENL